MAAVDFPDTPTTGQVFQVGTRRWEYDGTKWKAKPFGNEPFTANTVTATTVNATTLNVDSTEIDLTGTTTGDTLVYDGAKYSPSAFSAKIDASLYSAKGSILTADGLPAITELAVGANGTVLTADSSTATGLTWDVITDDTKIAKSTLLAKGSLITATSSGTPVNFGVGTDGNILLADSTQGSGLRWGAISSSSIGDDTIDTAKIVDLAVTTGKLAAYSVTSDKMGPLTLNYVSLASYLLIGADRNKVIIMNSSVSNQTLTIPADASVFFETGTQIAVIRGTTNEVTIAGDTGVTIRSDGNKKRISQTWTSVSLIKLAPDEWFLAGSVKT